MDQTDDARPPLMRIYTFGGITLEQLVSSPSDPTPRYQRIPHDVWQSRGPALTMLKILVSCPVLSARQATQEELIDAIWTEDDQQKMGDVEKALRSAASILRKVLTPEGSTESLLLVIPGTSGESTIYKLVGQDRLWIDADHFETLVARAIRTSDVQAVQPLWQEAKHVYQGTFLDSNRYQDWSQARRESLHADYRRLVLYLADLYLRSGEVQMAGELLEPFVALYPTDEDALCALMSVLEHQGSYHAAWQLYRRARGQEGPQDQQLSHRLHAIAKRIRERLRTPAQPLLMRSHIDWGEAPQAETLYGRSKELEQLETWIVQNHARLVAVVGMAGIGKTSLVVNLVEQVKSAFECILWRSLHNAPSLRTLLAQCLTFFSPEQAADMPTDEATQITMLLRLLQQHRCLLILDGMESLFQPGTYAGTYREGYTGYGTLLSQAGEARHQSCILLISRELPREMVLLEEKYADVHTYQIDGLSPEEGWHLLQKLGMQGTEGAMLVQTYAGNPLLLKLVVRSIHEMFQSDVARFLHNGIVVIDEVREVLDTQWGSLSLQEQDLLSTIVREPEGITLTMLQETCESEVEKRVIVKILRSLQLRSLMKLGATGIALSKVLRAYIVERFAPDHQVMLTTSTFSSFARIAMPNEPETTLELDGVELLDKSRRHMLWQTGSLDSTHTFVLPDTLSRRQALMTVLIGVSGVVMGIPTTVSLSSLGDEVLPYCAANIASAWTLANGNRHDMFHAKTVVASYLPLLTDVARRPSSYQTMAADLATQCYRLEAILGYHTENLSVAEQKAKKAVTYSRMANNPNLLVTSLVLHALISYYTDRPEMALEKCLEASQYLHQVTHAVRSYLYRMQAACLAQLDQEEEALTTLDLAHEMFLKHPASEKPFVHAAHDQFELYLWDGITHMHLGQYDKASQALEQVDPHNAYAVLPPRVRTGFLNNLVFMELRRTAETRDMERCITLWTEAMRQAVVLKSELRFQEAYRAYNEMMIAFPGESRVKQLRRTIRRWDHHEDE